MSDLLGRLLFLVYLDDVYDQISKADENKTKLIELRLRHFSYPLPQRQGVKKYLHPLQGGGRPPTILAAPGSKGTGKIVA